MRRALRARGVFSRIRPTASAVIGREVVETFLVPVDDNPQVAGVGLEHLVGLLRLQLRHQPPHLRLEAGRAGVGTHESEGHRPPT